MKQRKTVVVVGAAGGVGGETARMLIAAGFDVIATVLNDAEKKMAARKAPGVRRFVMMDLGNPASVARSMAAIARDRQIKTLWAVVICAAISCEGPLEITPLQDLRRSFEVNAVSNVGIYQGLAAKLRESRGRLVLVSSTAGKVAFPFLGFYSASKFALEAIADVMRREAAPWGVQVSVVQPGAIRTTMVSNQRARVARNTQALRGEQRRLYGETFAAYGSLIDAAMPLAVTPQVVAKVVLSAVTARRPKPRYPVSSEGRAIVTLARDSSDAQIDRFLVKSWSQGGRVFSK